MSILKTIYKDKVDHTWYESSNIVYSKCIDHEDAFKELYVVFKNGACYLYKNVNVNDYLLFKNGGLDGSCGKALNQFIKGRYEFERVADENLEELEKLKTTIDHNDIDEVEALRLEVEKSMEKISEVSYNLKEFVGKINPEIFNNLEGGVRQLFELSNRESDMLVDMLGRIEIILRFRNEEDGRNKISE